MQRLHDSIQHLVGTSGERTTNAVTVAATAFASAGFLYPRL